MTRFIVAVTLLVVAAAPAFACDYNKSAAASSTTTVSQSGTSHSGKAAQNTRG
jgi:hypothetical protein